MRTPLLLISLLVACGGDDNSGTPDAPKPPIDTPKPIDAPPDGPDIRGPKSVDLTGGANAVFWDDATSTLFLTDNNADALLKYTDAMGVQSVSTLPAGSAGISLGDIVKRADGTILTTNFGFGTQGTIFAVDSTNTASALTGLDPARRRIGLAQDSGGLLYEAYFINAGMMMQAGGVSSVSITGSVATEVEIAGVSTTAGFKKLVGLVATPTAVFVSDQVQKMIFQIAIPGNAVTTLATVPSADLLAVMPNGDLLTGGTPVPPATTATISRVTPTGTVTTLDVGMFESVRGMAYDPTAKRLFLIEHSATAGTPDKLHIVPLDQ